MKRSIGCGKLLGGQKMDWEAEGFYQLKNFDEQHEWNTWACLRIFCSKNPVVSL